MKFARGKIIAAFALGAVILLGTALSIRINRQRALARPTLSPLASSLSIPPELKDALAQAERDARGYFGMTRGVAELSRLYHANGFFEEARRCYESLQRLEPNAARWPHLHANLLAGFGDLAGAESLQARAVLLQPGYVPAALRLGEIHLKASETAAAKISFERVLQREADNRYARLGLAKCAWAAEDLVGAREQLRQILARSPDFAGALSLSIAIEERAGNLDTARALIVKLGKREAAEFPDPWIDELSASCFDPYRLSVAAATALAAEDPAAARRWLERAIRLDPKEGKYRRQLGKLFLQDREFPRAREQLEQAVALTPSDSDAWVLLSEIATAMGDAAASDRALVAGLKLNPQSPALHYALGHRLSEAGRFAEAVKALKQAQALRPNEVNAGIDLAMIYFRAERIEEGVAELRGVLANQPGHPLAMEILTRHAISSNDEVDARRWFHELQLQPRVPKDDLKAIAVEFRQQFGRAPR